MTENLAGCLAKNIHAPMRIYLSGKLGCGKTLWTRSLLRALGEVGRVPSPGYALAYTYQMPTLRVHHLDLFRQIGELSLDLTELIDDDALSIVEWPERVSGLAVPDLFLNFVFAGENHRRITLTSNSEQGKRCLKFLS